MKNIIIFFNYFFKCLVLQNDQYCYTKIDGNNSQVTTTVNQSRFMCIVNFSYFWTTFCYVRVQLTHEQTREQSSIAEQ